jgi:hypothetical protein
MLAAEVHQNQAQPLRVPLVAPQPRGSDVIADHAPNVADAAGQMSQVIAEFCGNDFREVLVLGNSVDFLFREIGEGQTVLDRNHGDLASEPRYSPRGGRRITHACSL